MREDCYYKSKITYLYLLIIKYIIMIIYEKSQKFETPRAFK